MKHKVSMENLVRDKDRCKTCYKTCIGECDNITEHGHEVVAVCGKVESLQLYIFMTCLRTNEDKESFVKNFECKYRNVDNSKCSLCPLD